MSASIAIYPNIRLFFKVKLPIYCVYPVLVLRPSCVPERSGFNTLNTELNPICYLLALLGAHHFLHVSRIRVSIINP